MSTTVISTMVSGYRCTNLTVSPTGRSWRAAWCMGLELALPMGDEELRHCRETTDGCMPDPPTGRAVDGPKQALLGMSKARSSVLDAIAGWNRTYERLHSAISRRKWPAPEQFLNCWRWRDIRAGSCQRSASSVCNPHSATATAWQTGTRTSLPAAEQRRWREIMPRPLMNRAVSISDWRNRGKLRRRPSVQEKTGRQG